MSEQNEPDNNPIDDEYLTYNGLNRPATIMGGIPIILAFSLLGIALFSLFILIRPFGWFGIIPAVICGLIMMIIKVINEDDPNALKFMFLKIQGWVIRKGQSVFLVGGDK
ncbi:TPA: VirB3 family type IV secretion system protein [Morganella morganii]|nr:VirB3 family type IV secretion system protein [Morganella morganii]HDF2424508.1 VirB3 family type IV secretion system protein [Morganella morganii]